jgi:molybdenum cofactor guanylyltransferase
MVMPLAQSSLPLPYSAYLLAAGQSRRFGSNKAFAHWQGTSFLNYQLQLLQAYFVTVKVVAPAPNTYEALGVTGALVDRLPFRGPLAGLDTALHDLAAGGPGNAGSDQWLFLASCDTFGVLAEDILKLAQALPHATGKYQAVLWQSNAQPEPLWGFYSVNLAARVYERLSQGHLAMHTLLKTIPVKFYDRHLPWIQVNALADFPEKA